MINWLCMPPNFQNAISDALWLKIKSIIVVSFLIGVNTFSIIQAKKLNSDRFTLTR